MKPQSQVYSRYYTYIKPFAKLPVIKTYGSTIFTILIVIFFIFYAIKPTVETILVLQKQLVDSASVLEKVNQKAKILSAAKQNYNNLDPKFKSKLTNYIPDTVNLKSVILSLETTAKQHNASISAIQIQPLVMETNIGTGSGTLSEILFTFNTTGEYPNLISILQDLKKSNRLISIDHLSLSKVTDGTALIMSLSGKAYYIKK